MSLVRKHQIQEWQEVTNAQTTATDANSLATSAKSDAETAQTAAETPQTTAATAQTTAATAQTTANAKLAGHVKIVKLFAALDPVIGQMEFTLEAGSSEVIYGDIIDVELLENGVVNDDATVSYAADIRQVNGVTVPVTVFTVTGLDNAIFEGDKFTFKIGVKAFPVPN